MKHIQRTSVVCCHKSSIGATWTVNAHKLSENARNRGRKRETDMICVVLRLPACVANFGMRTASETGIGTFDYNNKIHMRRFFFWNNAEYAAVCVRMTPFEWETEQERGKSTQHLEFRYIRSVCCREMVESNVLICALITQTYVCHVSNSFTLSLSTAGFGSNQNGLRNQFALGTKIRTAFADYDNFDFASAITALARRAEFLCVWVWRRKKLSSGAILNELSA